MPFGALLPFLFQDGIHLLQSARSASVANTVLQRLRHSALQSGRYYLGSPMLALQWLRGQDEVPGTACQPLKTMGMYWNLKFGGKKTSDFLEFLGRVLHIFCDGWGLLLWGFASGGWRFAAQYGAVGRPTACGKAVGGRRVWDQCSIWIHMGFLDQDWGVNQQLLVFNQQLLELFHRVSPTKNFSWGIQQCGVDSRFSR